jgi:hypothetical protein
VTKKDINVVLNNYSPTKLLEWMSLGLTCTCTLVCFGIVLALGNATNLGAFGKAAFVAFTFKLCRIGCNTVLRVLHAAVAALLVTWVYHPHLIDLYMPDLHEELLQLVEKVQKKSIP